MKLRKSRPNVPHRAPGLLATPRDKPPVHAGTNMPKRLNTGYDDRKGYAGGDTRRNGPHTGPAAKADQSRRKGAEGNGKGAAPDWKHRPNTAHYQGDAPPSAKRGVMGKPNGYTGGGPKYPDDLSSKDFERLGAE